MLSDYETKQVWSTSLQQHRQALEAAGVAHGKARNELERVYAAIHVELQAARAARPPRVVTGAEEPWDRNPPFFVDGYSGAHKKALHAAQAAEQVTHAELQRLEKRLEWVTARAVLAGAVAPGR